MKSKLSKTFIIIIHDFESRVVRMAGIANNYLKQYKENISTVPDDFEVEPTAYLSLGLSPFCSKQDAFENLLQIQCVNILIYGFAVLFEGTQQGTRYSENFEGKIVLPTERYQETENIITGLSSMMSLLDYIIKSIYPDVAPFNSKFLQ